MVCIIAPKFTMVFDEPGVYKTSMVRIVNIFEVY
jgi:hypothetical protein|nr:MAG TPA: hypothetical protein [Caudoviricetes sp.]